MKKYISEFVGTAVLVAFAVGSAIFGFQAFGDSAYLAVAFAFGLVIVAMAYSIGTVSGCHINPAVSLSMLIAKRITVAEFFGYVICQFAGAIVGYGILVWIMDFSGFALTSFGVNGANGLFDAGNTANVYGKAGPIISTFLIEIILTFVFVTVIMSVTGKKGNPKLAGLVIGFTLTLVHIIGIPLTGTSVNPARSLAPALFIGLSNLIKGNGVGPELSNVWIFILAPLVGGVLAALFSKYILDTEKCACCNCKTTETTEVATSENAE